MSSRPINTDFRCLHCGAPVCAGREVCAVNNRNHCPYCLWSRHLDLQAAGDRLSACKAPMQPVGLSTKPGRNKYSPGGGELLLVHACTGCGRLSLNRLAADDDPQVILLVFRGTAQLPASIRAACRGQGIRLLEAGQAGVVQRQLYGLSAWPAAAG